MHLLIEPHYLASLEYFVSVIQAESIVWEVNAHFTKQTYKNRCTILADSGVMTLSIPVIYGNHTPFKEVKIDHTQSWVRQHWGAFYSAYGKAPYFEFFADEFYAIWHAKPDFLLDLNHQMMTLCLKLLQCDREIEFTDHYQKIPDSHKYDLRERIHPKKPFTSRKIYLPFPYTQNFGSNFAPNMSIVDLLLTEGPQAIQILKKSIFPSNEQI